MTTKKQELKKNIWRIWEILTISKECFQYTFYLHKPSTKEEIEYLNHSSDFAFIRHILWRMTIIELSKLFSVSKKRDKFNIHNFVKKLNRNEYFGDIGISESTVKKWERKLSENQKIIDNILILRDKIYAHTDPKKEDYKSIEITFQEIEVLIKLTEEIIQEIYLVAFDSGTDMSTPNFSKDRFNVIKILAKEKEERTKEFLDTKFKKED